MTYVQNTSQVIGAKVLITGGTGSFGSTVIPRLVEAGAREIRVFSRDELKQHEMRQRMQGMPVKFYVGDIRDPDALGVAMRGVDHVFHAAALKQVPSCEFFPEEAVKTNVTGSHNVLQAALQRGCWQRGAAVYGQGCAAHQCDGYDQGVDGEAWDGVRSGASRWAGGQHRALRQRDDEPGFCHPVVHRPVPTGEAVHRDGSVDDSVPDAVG